MLKTRKGNYHKYRYSSESKMRQQQFNNRYTINDKSTQYYSFADPHTSYYFSSSPVKANLKHLKKAILTQKSIVQKKKIAALVKERIKKNIEFNELLKRQNYFHETHNFDVKRLTKGTAYSLNTFSNKKPSKNYTCSSAQQTNQFPNIKLSQLEQFEPQGQNDQLDSLDYNIKKSKTINPQNFHNNAHKAIKYKMTQKQFASKLAEQLHQKKRLKWLNFLQEKKHTILQSSDSERVRNF